MSIWQSVVLHHFFFHFPRAAILCAALRSGNVLCTKQDLGCVTPSFVPCTRISPTTPTSLLQPPRIRESASGYHFTRHYCDWQDTDLQQSCYYLRWSGTQRQLCSVWFYFLLSMCVVHLATTPLFIVGPAFYVDYWTWKTTHCFNSNRRLPVASLRCSVCMCGDSIARRLPPSRFIYIHSLYVILYSLC